MVAEKFLELRRKDARDYYKKLKGKNPEAFKDKIKL
jgi:hypothetical protein